MFDRIVFASKNKGKIREIKQLFANINIEVLSVPDNFEAIENGQTFLDNAIIKAKKAVDITGLPAIADDSGLNVDALGGKPGVHSSRYAKDDQSRIKKLLDDMKNVPEKDRTARFVCSMALVSSEGNLLYSTSGTCEGRIIFQPEGTDGFGFDPVFLVSDLNLTMAQIPLEQKNTISHRAKAFRHMLTWFENNKNFATL